jgi:hypothetical protein
MVVEMRLGEDRPAGTPRELFAIGEPKWANAYAVTPDGERILAIVSEDTAIHSATIMLDWAAGGEQRR